MKLQSLLEARHHKIHPKAVYHLYKSIVENDTNELHPDILFDTMDINAYDAKYNEDTNVATMLISVWDDYSAPLKEQEAIEKFEKGLQYIEKHLGESVPYTSKTADREVDDYEQMSIWNITLTYK